MKIRFDSLITACILALSLFTYYLPAAAYEDTDCDGEYAEMLLIPEEVELNTGYLNKVGKYASNEKNFLFYDQLDKNNKAVYEQMKKWIEPTEESLMVSFPETLTFTASAKTMSKWTKEEYTEFWEMVFQNVVYGERAVLLDYPEMFWFNTSPIKIAIENLNPSHNFLTGKYSIRVSNIKMSATIKEEYGDIETAKKYKNILKDAIDEFEVEGNDRYEQVKYIHDYICNAVVYDIEAPYRDAAVGVFCEPYRIVCEGYSKSFKLLCDKMDIPCVSVTGNIDSATKVGHIWNYVMMEDGKWYAVDCTWDDIDSVDPGIKYEFFLKGSDSFNKKHKNEAGLSYPELSAEDYVYDEPPTEETTEPEESSDITEETTEETTEAQVREKGDYNNDGQINLADLVLLRRYITFNIEFNEYVADIDLNDDGRVDVFDCIVLMRSILGGF